MYRPGSDAPHPQAPQPGYEYLDKDYTNFWHHHHQPHNIHGHQQYPISAPAVATASEDYFSFSANEPQERPSQELPPRDPPVEFLPSLFKKPGEDNFVETAKVRLQLQTNAGNYSNKIRHRSNLSHSYTSSNGYEPPETASEPETSFQPSQHQQKHQQNPQQHQQHQQHKQQQQQQQQQQQSKLLMRPSLALRKNSRNPGFRLQLDNLEVPNPVQRFQLQISASPHSDSSFELNYDHMQIMDPDVFLQQGGTGDLDNGQENITPLMNPPKTTEHGYFGAYDPPETRLNDDSVLGGYLTVPPEADEQESKNSDTNSNSELDNYINYPVDGFNEYYDYANEGHGHGLENETYHNHDFGYYNSDDTRAEASFIPIVHENEGMHEQTSDDHHGRIHGIYPQDTETSFEKSQHLQSQDTRGDVLQHDYQHADNQQHHHQVDHRQEPYAYPNQGPHQEHIPKSGQEPHQEHDNRHVQSHEDQQEYFQDTRTDSSQHHVLEFPPVRPELERSVSGPSAPGKPLDKKLLAKKKKSPKGTVCTICDKFISRDFSRHIRIHNEVGRFQCVFPRNYCKHRSGKFNRPYDYKKHLLNMHFNFDDPSAKSAPNLTDKLDKTGLCVACGQKFVGTDWLEHHVLTKDLSKLCSELYQFDPEQE